MGGVPVFKTVKNKCCSSLWYHSSEDLTVLSCLDEASQKFDEIAQLFPTGMGKDSKGKYLQNKQELGITFSLPEHMGPTPSPGQCAQLLLHQKSLSSAWSS